LLRAVEQMLVDTAARERMRTISARVQADPGRIRAASLIERVARDGQPAIR